MSTYLSCFFIKKHSYCTRLYLFYPILYDIINKKRRSK
nr:MAG TPA: hypothetical protein [Caudoviricetes sp.]